MANVDTACTAYNSINGKNRFYVLANFYTPDPDEAGPLTESNDRKWVANVKTVSGLEIETEVNTWKAGDLANEVKLPGAVKFPAITLHKGFDGNSFFYRMFMAKWFGTFKDVACRKLWIYVLRKDMTVFRAIEIKDAWVSKYSGDDLDGSSSDPWMEQIEISHGGWSFIDPEGLATKAYEPKGNGMEDSNSY